MEEEKKMDGAFLTSLKRNNKQIKEDRALAISDDAEMIFRRKVEDIGLQIKRMKRDRENMLDLSPTTAQSLVLASDFNADEFVNKEIDLAIKIREATIKLELATERYKYLFGGGV